MAQDDAPLIDRIDHFVLTVASVDATCAFYERALGLRRIDTPGRPTALQFGAQKINLHEAGHAFAPKAARPMPGSADFCLIATVPLDRVTARLARAGVAPELGPVARNGALGPMMSVYFRDPDGNLVEVSVYD
ncbi:MAG: VOC family protein [Rhodobacteraceae bacterium]|nr:VOC family protein [Paracoccaceae bacterium]